MRSEMQGLHCFDVPDVGSGAATLAIEVFRNSSCKTLNHPKAQKPRPRILNPEIIPTQHPNMWTCKLHRPDLRLSRWQLKARSLGLGDVGFRNGLWV